MIPSNLFLYLLSHPISFRGSPPFLVTTHPSHDVKLRRKPRHASCRDATRYAKSRTKYDVDKDSVHWDEPIQLENHYNKTSSTDYYTIRFSRNFQRFVVTQHNHFVNTANKKSSVVSSSSSNVTIMESFSFLDEAIVKYPTARLEPCIDTIGPTQDEDHDECIIAGMGTTPSRTMLLNSSQPFPPHENKQEVVETENNLILVGSEGQRLSRSVPGFQSLEYLAYIAVSCGNKRISPPPLSTKLDYAAVECLGKQISQNRFAAYTPMDIYNNFQSLVRLFTFHHPSSFQESSSSRNNLEKVGLAMDEKEALNIIASFPPLCLYNPCDLEDRIRFMISPFPDFEQDMFQDPRRKYIPALELDPYSTKWKGYGAGLSIEQATDAVKNVPQLLSMFHEDSKKPSIIYFYQYLKVPMAFIDEVRSELSNYLSGSDHADVCTFAYLRTLDIRLDQMKLLLEAMPTLTYCVTEDGFRFKALESNQAHESRLHFLRKRLQLTNGDIKAMIKTHSRLKSYHLKNNILPTLNAVQESLSLSSRELRKLILRMPSIIGMCVKSPKENEPSSLEKRIHFFVKEANMCLSDAKYAVLKQPALLQYSLDSSLKPKMKYLIEEVGVPQDAIGRIITLAPATFGLSLDRTLKGTVSAIRERCDFSKDQFGALIATEPYILTLSLKNKIEPTFTFLSNILQISTTRELGSLIEAAPRVFLQSIESSLMPKFELLKNALEVEGEANGRPLSSGKAENIAAYILKNNPALLTTTLSIFEKRVNQYLIEKSSLQEAFQPRTYGRKRLFTIYNNNTVIPISAYQIKRKRQKVVELSSDEKTIIRTFSSVNDAAEYLDVSASSIYLSCSRNGKVKNRLFRYADDISVPSSTSKEEASVVSWNKTRIIQTSGLGLKHIDSGLLNLFDPSTSSVSLSLFVSSSIYPKDDIHLARGSRKAGGIALHFPAHGQELGAQLRSCTQQSFGNTMPEGDMGSNFSNGLILCTFPYSRPSRNRCDLYACHCALKLINQLIRRACLLCNNRMDLNVHVKICTDSSYAWKILNDRERLVRWGSIESIDAFVFDGDCPESMANIDLLFPLAQMLHKMTQGNPFDRIGKECSSLNRLSIEFCHSTDILLDKAADGYMKKMSMFAASAAAFGYAMY